MKSSYLVSVPSLNGNAKGRRLSTAGDAHVIRERSTDTATLLPGNSKAINEYVELKQLIKQAALLNKQPVYYTFKITATIAMLAISVTLLLLFKDSWFQLFNAAFFALASAQIGFLGHDAGHRQVFHKTWQNNLMTQLFGNLLIGMGNDWWLDKHNRHHSHPNELDMDPDIDFPIIAFTEEDALKKRSYQRFIVKYQAFFFLPILSLVGIDLQIRSVRFLIERKSNHTLLEGLLLTLHYLLILGLLLFTLNPWQALAFFVLYELLFGLFLGSAFAPNHKGMPVIGKNCSLNFLHRQVITSRNVESSPFNDFWYGGLNYQVEHHLFPSMPRNNLKKAQRIVKTYCQAHGIPYYETNIRQSYKEILGFLHSVSSCLRDTQA